MAILLYNKTAHDSVPIRAALTYAARRVDVEGNVIVKVTPSRRVQPGAHFHTGWPYIWHLAARRVKGKGRLLTSTPTGWVTMSLPRHCRGYEITAAEWFCRTALHEMAHVRDHRRGTLERDEKNGTRRAPWVKRACEVKAENAVYDARPVTKGDRVRVDDLVLGIALVLEAAALKWLKRRLTEWASRRSATPPS